MGGVKWILGALLTKKAFKKIVAYVLLIVLLYVFRDFLGIFFLTFIFAYFFYSMATYMLSKMRLLWEKYESCAFLKKIPFWSLILCEYVVFLGIVVYVVSNIVPALKFEVTSLVEEFSFSQTADLELWALEPLITWTEKWAYADSWSTKILHAFNDLKQATLDKLELIDPDDNLKLSYYVETFGSDINLWELWKPVLEKLWAVWTVLSKVILALVLSFIFIIDRQKLGRYLGQMEESHFKFLYIEYKFLLEKVVKSFGVTFKAQWMIAFVNAVLTVVGLLIIGFVCREWELQTFPYILTFGLVVFIFGFVPVLWVILSSIPIMLIAYVSYSTPMVTLMVLVLIIVVHMVEAYYLNPKIVSRFLELPVSLTFIILLLSQHFFWLAWLLIWVSLFYFAMSLLQDFNWSLQYTKKRKFFYKKSKE